MIIRWISMVTLGIVVACASQTAFGENPYLNQLILPKRPNIAVQVGGTVVGDEMDFEWPLRAERFNGQWLWIRDDGSNSPIGQPKAGWVSKNDVVLLKNDPIEKIGAIEYLTRRIEQNQDAAWTFLFRGIAWEDAGDWRVAISDLREAARRNPSADLAWSNLGYCLYRLAGRNHQQLFDSVRKHEQLYLDPALIPKDLREAIDSFRRAVALRERASTLVYWGNALAADNWSEFQRNVYTFLFENPETFTDRAPDINQTDNCPDHSAMYLYNRALRICPGYDQALYGKAGMYAYAVDYRVWKMAESSDWKALAWASELRETQKQLKTVVDRATKAVQKRALLEDRFRELTAIADDLEDRKLFKQRSTKLGELYDKAADAVDTAQDDLHVLEQKLRALWQDQEVNSPAFQWASGLSDPKVELEQLQIEVVRDCNPLIFASLENYEKAIAGRSTFSDAARDRASMWMICLDPTGRHPIMKPPSDDDVDRDQLVAVAKASATMAAKANDYENGPQSLAVLASTLNAQEDYSGAVRRQKQAMAKMTPEQRKGSMIYLQLYCAHEKDHPSKIDCNESDPLADCGACSPVLGLNEFNSNVPKIPTPAKTEQIRTPSPSWAPLVAPPPTEQ